MVAHRNSKIKELTGYIQSAQSYLEKGECEKALAPAESLIRSNDVEARMFGNAFKGMALYGLDRYDEAIKSFTSAIDIARSANQLSAASIAFLHRGDCYYFLDNLSAAMSDFATFIQMEPQQPHGYLRQARALIDLGDLDQALHNVNQAISLDPSYAYSYAQRAKVYAHRDETQKAIDDLSRAIKLEATEASYYRRRADLYARVNDTAAAIADYSRAIELDPTDLESYKGRGVLYQRSGNAAAASADLSRVSSEGPFQQAYNAYFQLANTTYNRGIKAVYSEADQHASTNWLSVFLGTIAFIAIGFVGLLILSAVSRNSCIALMLIVAVPVFIVQLFVASIKAARAKRENATTYIQTLRANEQKTPGFEEFFKQFLQAKKDSQVAELPRLTRSFFETGPGTRAVQQYRAGQ
jgi:tetratricopeptide (TPR) repeat protein